MAVAPTRISLSFPEPEKHFCEVRSRTPGLQAGSHLFFMPVWTPGSYLIREYPRHVEGMRATDSKGRGLPIRKTAKNRWELRLEEPGEVCLRYRVYCRDLTVRTNHVDERRAFWNGAATYILALDRKDAPLRIEVDLPEGWRAHTGLPLVEGSYRAGDLDEAADCPFLAGPMPVESFQACGREHLLVCDGIPGEERGPLAADLRALVETAARIFGSRLPYERYLFLFLADETGSGGLEHANSSVIHVRRSSLKRPEDRLRVLGLCAHEHFHAWNVKRIRPEGLATFDYETENYSPDLWLSEGLTTYYQEVLPYLAGLADRQRFLDRLAENIHLVLGVPGRRLMSLSESSFDAWIKLYRPDENTRNSTVSYYQKGALAALCLDLRIQEGSGGRNSLDRVMRGLFEDYERRGPGQGRELFLELANEASGADLRPELEALLDGREDPDLPALLEPFGLYYQGPDGPLQASLDIRTKIEEGRLLVVSVDRDGAGVSMGLSPGDEILGADGERVLPGDFQARIQEEHRPGGPIELTLSRRGLLTTVRGTLGGKASGRPRITESGEGRLCFRPRSEGGGS